MKPFYIILFFLFSGTCIYGQCSPDVTPPAITCPSNISVPCPHAVPSLTPTTSDFCGAVVLQTYALSGATSASSPSSGINDASSENFLAGTTTVTYYIEDASGNSATCNFTVTINDFTDPIIECEDDIFRVNDFGNCTAVVNMYGIGVYPSAFDSCSGLFIVPTGIPPGGAFPVGTTTVTWTVSDAAGNSSSCTQDVTVTDEEDPTIACPSDIVVNTDSEQCDAVVSIPLAIPMDNCSIISISNDYNSGGADASDTYPIGTTTITFTATDSANRTTTCSFDVTVVNSELPVITLLGADNLELEACDTYIEELATATDSCLGNITGDITIDYGAFNPNTVNALGTYFITYNVTNSVGDSAIPVIRTVTVVDTTPPVLTLNGPDPQPAGDCSTFTELGVFVNDPCFGDITVDPTTTITITSNVDTSVLGSYTVTYNATDASGNAASPIIRTVIVSDVTAPIITLIGDNPQTIEACGSYIELDAIAIDPCFGTDFSEDIVINISAINLDVPGTYPVTYNVSDTAIPLPNAAIEVIRWVEVVDTTVPTAICQDFSLQLDPTTGLATLLPEDINNGSTDNCSFNLTLSQESFDCSHLGANTITLTVTDVNGNFNSCDATVTITDLADNASVSIATPNNPICQNQEITFTAIPVNGGTTPSYQWQINGADVIGETGDTFTTSILNDGDEVTVIMTSSASICALQQTSNTITILVNEYNSPADAGADVTNTICIDTTISLNGSTVNGVNATGTWTVTSGQVSGFSFSDANSPTSNFTGDIGETYTLTWSIDNPDPCVDTSDSITVTFIGCNALDFDGVDDNITFRNTYNLGTAFSIEVWVKSDVTNTNIQTILSKRDASNLVDGYDLRLVNNIVSFNWNNGQSLSSDLIQITNSRWHHLAVTFDGSAYKLFIDGIEVNATTGSVTAPISNIVDCIAGAMDETITAPFKPVNYFQGGLDELRIWDVALTEAQIRKMMNQEVTDINPVTTTADGPIYGAVVPLQIVGLDWTDLNGYYQMNQTTDLSGGNLISISNSAIDGVLRYMTTLQPETAPLPYQSVSDGTWANASTWLYGTSQAIPNSMGIDGSTLVDWNIVRSSHNISSGDTNLTLLGLEVNANTLRIENTDPIDGQSLRVTDYLLIDGDNTVLKLVGESQLLQDSNSIVDYNGTGNLHRDQQGTNNVYNYNYWGSPVSTDGVSYAVGASLYDGAQPVQWTGGYNGIGNTTPVTMSSRWLYIYENYPVNSYADWVRIDKNYQVTVPLGFLMKGSGTTDAEQNYTFVGKPNNGTYISPISANFEALVANPYPSSLDAQAFINDNSVSTLGTIYFWEHYTTNDTHITIDYQGGFAAYNLSGGNPAVSPPEISGLGTPSKIPERYIPIGQGFNVHGNDTGGDIIFNNGQRVFVKEAVTGVLDNGSVFMRTQERVENRPDADPIQRIRIDFTTPDGALRPIMIGFVPNNLATDGYDYGYDALNTENLPYDLSWMIDDQPYIIQGVGDFDITKQYPLGIFMEGQGSIEISLRDLENFDSEIDVFVYDSLLGTYTPIHASDYLTTLDAGNYLNRFYITFIQDGVLSTIDDTLQNVVVNYLEDTDDIYIKTPEHVSVERVHLINILGQLVQTWTVSEPSRTLRIPVHSISEGHYVVKVETDSGTINKKVIVNY